MKHSFISSTQPQYRANLHSHSIYSDGHLTPEEMKAVYKEQGYSILAITDHEHPKDHSALTEPDFLMLTGYECYIRPDPNGKMGVYTPEVHLNLFAKDPHNETFICYDKPYGKYIKDPMEMANLRRAGSERPREYSIPYVNEYIRTAVENGYLVAYNHPVWSMEEQETILSYKNLFSLEMNNYGSYLGNYLEHNGDLYDKMLRRNMRLFVNAGDDNHNTNGSLKGSFGAWTMILAEELTYPSVIEAMEQGNMYASMGPAIHALSVEDGTVHVECSPAAAIVVHMGGKRSRVARTSDHMDGLISTDLVLEPDAPYFRVEVRDQFGRVASTRGYFRDEFDN